mmetsp:Transcript_16117/g.38290  ORF Transcript_16117/g.38290 Transcript_16117/m.38290 type:complete len:206 (-) Transcript_16117:480-1097(-)
MPRNLEEVCQGVKVTVMPHMDDVSVPGLLQQSRNDREGTTSFLRGEMSRHCGDPALPVDPGSKLEYLLLAYRSVCRLWNARCISKQQVLCQMLQHDGRPNQLACLVVNNRWVGQIAQWTCRTIAEQIFKAVQHFAVPCLVHAVCRTDAHGHWGRVQTLLPLRRDKLCVRTTANSCTSFGDNRIEEQWIVLNIGRVDLVLAGQTLK